MINHIRLIIRSPFFWISLLYLISARGHLEVIDTEYSIRTAKAIIENGTMRIHPVDNEFLKVSVNPGKDGKVYSQYGIGLAILFIPFIISGKILSVIFAIPQDILTAFLLSFYNIPFAILGLWFIKKILISLGRKKIHADATIVIIAIATAYWSYSITDFSEITQLCFLLGSLSAVLSSSHLKWRYFSFWFALLLSIKVAYIILLPVFFFYGLIEGKKNHSVLIKEIGNGAYFLAPFGILLGIANYLRFGSFFELGYGGNPGITFGINHFIDNCIPSTISLHYGILPFNPILIAFPLWIKVSQLNKSFACLAMLLIGTWFCFMCSYSYGWGWGWGQRYLFAIIPLSVLCIAFIDQVDLPKLSKILFVKIIICSSLIQLVSASTKFHEPLTMQMKVQDEFDGPYYGQLPSTILLFVHKLLDGSTNYPLSIIGGESNEYVNLSDYASFQGLNFWPVHALKFLNLDQYIRVVEISILSIIFMLQVGLLKIHLPKLLTRKYSD